MEQQSDLKTIGIRGTAVSATIGVIAVFFMISVFAGVANIALFGYYFKPVTSGFFWLLFADAFFAVFLVIGILNIIRIVNNNKMGLTPVLAYDSASDTFVCYDTKHGNNKIVIKNGNILAISGSSWWSNRELKIRYMDNGVTRVTTVGYARNIDGGALRAELNKYHKPQL